MTLTRDLAWLLGEVGAIAHVAIASAVTVHVLLYKRNVGAAISWMGIAWLSPFLGGALYFAFGINRVKRRARRLRDERTSLAPPDEMPGSSASDPLEPLEYAIGRLTRLPAEGGSDVRLLRSGDQAYPEMVRAIEGAQSSVGLVSYIFRDDQVGQRFIKALIAAHERGVQVRVLIDGVGSGWFFSGANSRLKRAGVPVDRFLHSYWPWRTPFLNLRNHRKLLVVDGKIAFTGGLNIGDENMKALEPDHRVRDTHFKLEGPVVEQLVEVFADDWLFQTGEALQGEAWFPPLGPTGRLAARVVTSGPDEDLEQIEYVVLHAIACARQSVRVVTPYFLPPELLSSALELAAMRGIAVEIVLPERSNHTALDWARNVPLRGLLAAGCRVRLLPPPFDHSKLMTVDDTWSLIGSSNWDTRSFRLNFELDVEVQGGDFARALTEYAHGGRLLTMAELDALSLPVRLRNSAARLMQPYL